MTLEPEFWAELESIARSTRSSVSALVADIDAERVLADPEQNLSSAVRVFVLTKLRETNPKLSK